MMGLLGAAVAGGASAQLDKLERDDKYNKVADLAQIEHNLDLELAKVTSDYRIGENEAKSEQRMKELKYKADRRDNAPRAPKGAQWNELKEPRQMPDGSTEMVVVGQYDKNSGEKRYFSGEGGAAGESGPPMTIEERMEAIIASSKATEAADKLKNEATDSTPKIDANQQVLKKGVGEFLAGQPKMPEPPPKEKPRPKTNISIPRSL